MNHDEDILPARLGITRLLVAFAVLSVVLLGALAVAPARGHFTEWRATQQRYNALAARTGAQPVAVELRQIWKPDLDVVDRCGNCHLAAAGEEPLGHEPLFAVHPPIPHEPADLGCTTCHGGQGRATTAEAAHGTVEHWDEPLIPRPHVQAGCGTCHTHVPIPNAELAARGRAIVEQNACRDCHRIDRVGRGDAPDLTYVGLKGVSPNWHGVHAAHAAAASGGAWRTSFAPLDEPSVAAVTAYLSSRVGAPRLMDGKLLAHQLGCRGCHRIGGVGGDDGPDLSDVGRRAASQLNFAGVRGEHTLAAYLTEHFVDPARVVPGSLMPDLGIGQDQAELLTTYMLSLRAREVPAAFWPRDRIRGVRLGQREFATDGASLFGAFCAACHGPRGEGRRFGALNVVFPAIGSAEFLSLADERFIHRTLLDGRPGRRMPAWGTKDGGLRPEEIDALVGYLRSLLPAAPALDVARVAAAPIARGHEAFLADCATCHGVRGEGSVIGPPLAARDNIVTQSDAATHAKLASGVPGTAMRAFRTYDARTLGAVIAFARSLPRLDDVHRAGWAPRPGDAAAGEPLFARHCSGCHGPRGTSGWAPGIGSPTFLAAASDGYLAATIVRGRGPSAMPQFGRPGTGHPQLVAEEVTDIVAFLRSLAGGQ